MYAVVALDPEMRLQYFECKWKDRPEWIEIAREKSRGLWMEDYSMGTGIMVDEKDGAITGETGPTARIWEHRGTAKFKIEIKEYYKLTY